MKKLLFSAILMGLVCASLLAAGCASSASGASYPSATARTAFKVRYGDVISTQAVEIEGEATIVGRLGGAWIGYAIGRGDSEIFEATRRVETAIGGVAGTVAGEAIERRIKTTEGVEIVVRLSGDEIISVVQEPDVEFSAGERVQVMFGSDGSTRVRPL